MKSVIFIISFMFSLNYLNAQDISIQSILDSKSLVLTSNRDSVKITYGSYYAANSKTINLRNHHIYADSVSGDKMGKYNKSRLKFEDGKKFKFKLDKKHGKVFVYNKEKKVVFEGKLIYEEKFGNLKSIEILKDDTGTKGMEEWVAMSTIQRIYSNHSNEVWKNVAFGAVMGVLIGVFVQ